ncbi:MAG TPA: thiamine pyrophosphate-dependent dehydrogenase E1 component subunit alpha [Dehalococcoidia bacterium]|nr:thiamine pyrophosphate-dependent dehydrogenase E1 component subunit alpha [Dehalococcoidia bacterium]
MTLEIASMNKTELLWLYERMALIRNFEETFKHLVETGRPLGSGHLYAGQEAVAVGVCAHLRSNDYIASTHRGHGHCIAKGVEPRLMMAELYGKVTGACKGKGGSMHITGFSVGMLGVNPIVGGGIPHAVGAALTAKVKKTDNVAVAFFGDGATNQGTFHESVNLAAVWRLPVVFVCENNMYAESTPSEYSIPVENVADRASAYNIPGVVVDGMDVFAVYEAAGEAVARARSGGGPTLLECKTYRYYGHFLGDQPERYRRKEEEEAWHRRDPLLSFRRIVLESELLREQDLEDVEQKVQKTVQEAVHFAEESPLPDPEELYKDVYVQYPAEALR